MQLRDIRTDALEDSDGYTFVNTQDIPKAYLDELADYRKASCQKRGNMVISSIKHEIIVPTLEKIGLYSDTALNLVTGTGLVESGYKTTFQYGGGPALGWFQMEPATHDDCWWNYLRYRPELAQSVSALCRGEKPSASLLQSNPAYAAAMCRVKYLRVPAPLPPNDAQSLSLYHKRYYNTMQGKADATKNIPLFQAAIDA